MQTQAADTADKEVQEKYVSRLRARLARPEITLADARDGMLDCFVSTYHTGVKQGLNGILGVDASPDQVAQVTTRMFKDRLSKRGVSFDAPTAEALNDVKEELDKELHFEDLPVEVSATHDQVCSLLLAKADGLIDHHGDASVLDDKASAKAPTVSRSAPTRSVSAVPPPPRAAALEPRRVPPKRASTVTTSLRQALAGYLDEIRDASATADPNELLAKLDRARSLTQSIAEFSR